ncbi:MAG: DJ-1/PfpI family protein [Deltaproteobacteria bacterium]|nr:DJ-1/PfpI family protein [Deltaproteobacteria bacterium]
MRIGFLIFPGLTELDLIGPYEIVARLPGAEIHLMWKDAGPVRTEHGLALIPTTILNACPPLDLLCVPGGPGVNELLTDAEVLAFLRRVAPDACWVTSVCTGALVLGAAGLLHGRRATTHWMSRHFLVDFGAIPVDDRVVVDGNVVTGGGVTAGIDFALRIVAEVAGRETAEAIQPAVEYDPHPPFGAGTPRTAAAQIVARAERQAAERQEYRAAQVARAVALLRWCTALAGHTTRPGPRVPTPGRRARAPRAARPGAAGTTRSPTAGPDVPRGPAPA